jgi:soluble lytic murein transglycosylase-like protein
MILAFFWLGAGSASASAALATGSGQNEASLAQETTDQLSLTSVSAAEQLQPLSPVFRPEVQYWSGAIQGWAAAAGLDPNLVATVMQIESCGDPRARSRAGAMGLFQVMPYHFAGDDDPYNPDTNAARGLAYLKRSLEAADGDARLALAGYNGGVGVIGRSESTWAAETQRYAYWGSGIYAEASSGATESLRLVEWMAAGGASLCRQASARLGINP